MEPFDGSQNPFDHLETYKTLILLHDYSDGVMCRAFPTTLKGFAQKWFNNLQLSNINSFSELSQSFISHFIGGRRYCKLATYLLNVKQSKGESLRDYVSRFNREVMQVDDVDKKVVLMGGAHSLHGWVVTHKVLILSFQIPAQQHGRVDAPIPKIHEYRKYNDSKERSRK